MGLMKSSKNCCSNLLRTSNRERDSTRLPVTYPPIEKLIKPISQYLECGCALVVTGANARMSKPKQQRAKSATRFCICPSYLPDNPLSKHAPPPTYTCSPLLPLVSTSVRAKHRSRTLPRGVSFCVIVSPRFNTDPRTSSKSRTKNNYAKPRNVRLQNSIP